MRLQVVHYLRLSKCLQHLVHQVTFVMLDDATNTSPVAAVRCLGKGKVTK